MCILNLSHEGYGTSIYKQVYNTRHVYLFYEILCQYSLDNKMQLLSGMYYLKAAIKPY